ncbi:MAG: helix-turn-helix domain-containing protein [Pleurocapsa sp. MO_226.B13]|nr:helix-turn-helix domain-containing protein [Pleurocapsa sp. MO_226.B13]
MSLENNIQKVNYAKERDSVKVFSKPALFSSHQANWTDIYLEYHRQPPHDTGEIVSPLPYLGTSLTAYNPGERWLDGSFYRLMESGETVIVPAEAVHRCQWQKEVLFFVISFEPAFLHRVGQELFKGDRLELIPQAELFDPLIPVMLTALKDELQEALELGGNGDSLYVERLKIALGVHLLKKYTTQEPLIRDYADGLSGYQLQQTLNYIQAHLQEKIKIEDIAKLLNMSQFYFVRLFRRSLGVSPYQYIIQQRVEHAQKLLTQQRSLSIAQVARQCGFSHQSHLAKYFRQFTNMTPKQYRKRV